MLTRIACSKSVQKKITRWRQEHEDWEALAAFAVSKTTGRRFKHKPHGDSNTVSSSGETETIVDRTKAHDKTNVNLSNGTRDDDKMFDSDSVTFTDKSRQTSLTGSKLPGNKCVQNKPHHSEQVNEWSVGSSLVSRSDAVVRQISLDELSDEELFLPPPSEDETSGSTQAAAVPSKIASGFFVVSDEEDSEAGEFPANEALAHRAAASSSDTNDDDGDDATSASALRRSVKLSTMFAGSLSQRRSHNAVVKTSGRDKKRKSFGHQNQSQKTKETKRFSDRPFTKSRGSFPSSRGSHYPKKSEKYSHGNAKISTKYVELACYILQFGCEICLFV